MAFNAEKFKQASMTQRNSVIPVPELADFFDDGEKAEWTVRTITGEELATVHEAVKKFNLQNAVQEAIAEGTPKGLAKGLGIILGKDEDYTPEDYIYRLSLLRIASVSPSCDEDTALKLAQSKPNTFYKITNKILNLIGEGADLGK